jgi:elongation factor Ts
MTMKIQDIQYLRQETGAGIMDCKNALSKTNGDLQQALAVLQEQGFQLAKKKADRVTTDGIAYAEVFGNRAILLEVNTETDFVSGNDEFVSYVKKIAKAIAEHTPGDVDSLLECTTEAPGLTVGALLQKMTSTFRENIVVRRFEVLAGDTPVAYMHQKGRFGVILNIMTDGDLDHYVLYGIGKELAMQITAMSPQFVSRFHLSDDTKADIKAQIVREIEEDGDLGHKPPQVIDKIVSGRIEKFYRANCLLEQDYIKDDSITVQQFMQTAAPGSGAQIKVTGFFRYEKADGLQSEEGINNCAYARQVANR